MENTLHKRFHISSYDVDPKGKARLTAIANYLQETAYKHAASLDLGYHHLAKKSRAWVLSRLRIRMHQYPEWDDEIEVETWPRGIEKLFALRDFRIRSSNGDLFGEASTCWLMVDINSHRPLRFATDFIPIEIRSDAVFEKTPSKIDPPEKLSRCNARPARYSDLDVVGHVNNVKFIEWCLDAFPADDLLTRIISDFEINFVGEAKHGQQVDLFCKSQSVASSENVKFITGMHAESNRECFRAQVTFLGGHH